MTIYNKKSLRRKHKIEIDLTGPDGNAYVLLGLAKRFCTQLNRDWNDVNNRITSGDYENLIKVFDEEFGAYVDLYR